jgi:hypothetical protein
LTINICGHLVVALAKLLTINVIKEENTLAYYRMWKFGLKDLGAESSGPANQYPLSDVIEVEPVSISSNFGKKRKVASKFFEAFFGVQQRFNRISYKKVL